VGAGVSVDGFDVDEASIADARRNAAGTEVAERVRFEVLDVAGPSAAAALDEGSNQLVTVFEALHDMARPVEAPATCRRLCAADGVVVVMDERVAETFDPGGRPDRAFPLRASVLHCLPVGRAEPDSVATGAMMRPDALRRYAAAAGFADVEVLAIEHDLFRFYRLKP